MTAFKIVVGSRHTTSIISSLNNFYLATLCVSAVFAVARCLSVRLSVTLVDLSTGLKISSNADIQFQEKPLQRGRKIHGVGKFCDFRLRTAVYLGNGMR